jgi:hypothetical protein
MRDPHEYEAFCYGVVRRRIGQLLADAEKARAEVA